MDQPTRDDLPPIEKMLDKPVLGASSIVVGSYIRNIFDKGVNSEGWHKYLVVSELDGLVDAQFAYVPPETPSTGLGHPESVNSILHRLFRV